MPSVLRKHFIGVQVFNTFYPVLLAQSSSTEGVLGVILRKVYIGAGCILKESLVSLLFAKGNSEFKGRFPDTGFS